MPIGEFLRILMPYWFGSSITAIIGVTYLDANKAKADGYEYSITINDLMWCIFGTIGGFITVIVVFSYIMDQYKNKPVFIFHKGKKKK